jgi:hypothetical protein
MSSTYKLDEVARSICSSSALFDDDANHPAMMLRRECGGGALRRGCGQAVNDVYGLCSGREGGRRSWCERLSGGEMAWRFVRVQEAVCVGNSFQSSGPALACLMMECGGGGARRALDNIRHHRPPFTQDSRLKPHLASPRHPPFIHKPSLTPRATPISTRPSPVLHLSAHAAVIPPKLPSRPRPPPAPPRTPQHPPAQ